MDNLYITRTDMRRIIGILCLFVVVCTLSCAFILGFTDNEHSKRLDELEENYEYSMSDSIPYSRRPVYVAAVYNDGSIAIFSASDGSVIQLLDVAVRSLPDTDIRLLYSGIPLYSDDELCSLIADYTG